MTDKAANKSWIIDNLLNNYSNLEAIGFHTEDYIYVLVNKSGTVNWQEIIFTTADCGLEINELNAELAVMKLSEEIMAQESYNPKIPILNNPVKIKAAVDKLSALPNKENSSWMMTFLQIKEKSISFLHPDSLYALTQIDPQNKKWQDATIDLTAGDLKVNNMDSHNAIMRILENLKKISGYLPDFGFLSDQKRVTDSISTIQSL
ncbi:MAG: hypothetical protein ACTSUV_06950 [Candidatus Ranarchaeia archaeon]